MPDAAWRRCTIIFPRATHGPFELMFPRILPLRSFTRPKRYGDIRQVVEPPSEGKPHPGRFGVKLMAQIGRNIGFYGARLGSPCARGSASPSETGVSFSTRCRD